MSIQTQAGTILTFEDARRCVEDNASQVPKPRDETVPLLQSQRRFLSEEVRADRDFPPFNRATRDGYAVRSAELKQVPVSLKVASRIKAGDAANTNLNLGPGECVEIMTGAPVPKGLDAVVMVEYTTEMDGFATFERCAEPGQNIVLTGSEAKAGQVLLQRGIRMSPAHIGVAASAGKTAVNVYRRPRVAILSTGDEVVEVSSTPESHQIRNSNTYSLAAQVSAAGGEPLPLPIAPDESSRLERLIEEGLRSDLLILSGGVSMGKYDLVEDVLRRFNAEFFFTGALIQPGRPVVFGRATAGKTQTYFLGLPGNPVSTMVTFELFARPMVQALAGGRPESLIFAHARLTKDFNTKKGLTRFLPAVASGNPTGPTVELIAWQGSGDLAATARANCYLVVAPDKERLKSGESVPVLLFHD